VTGRPDIGGEEAIIQRFLAPLAAGYSGAFGLQDDCATIAPSPGHELVVKTDPIAAGVHFPEDTAPEDIGWKALAVNVSDLAAKGAVPRAYLLALSFPQAPTRDWMQRFAEGLGAAQRAFGMHLIGGDTDRRPGPFSASVTVFGEVPTGTMVRRGTAKPGDLVYVTGTLGDAAVGLALLREPALAQTWGLDAAEVAAAIARFNRPNPRLGLGPALRAHASAAMDISDGLAKDLDRMARASGCGSVVQLARLPLSPGVAKAVAADAARWAAVVAGGEDYEILVAVPRTAARAFEDAVGAAVPGLGAKRIGTFGPGSGVAMEQPDGQPLHLDRTGWDHF
jgi:thiamine-monophosphate kinase